MENKDCANLLIQLYADYFELVGRYGTPVVSEYSEAVAMAIMAMSGRAGDGK